MDNQEKIAFTRLLLKLMIFLPLIAVMVILPTVILEISGELKPLAKVAQVMDQSPKAHIVGLAYAANYQALKLIQNLEQKPEVLCLGTSGMMPVRAVFFKPSGAFFNAATGARRIEHFLEYLKRIPIADQPKVIIVGLNPNFFNPNWFARNEPLDSNKSLSDLKLTDRWLGSLSKVRQDFYVRRRFSVKDLSVREHDGLIAKVDGAGFLKDGSWHFGDILKAGRSEYDDGFAPTINKLTYGRRHFEFADHVAEDSLEQLRLFLDECARRGIYVVGILPPFPHKVVESLRDMGDKHSYLFKIPAAVGPIFAEYGFSFYDYLDPAGFGSNDKESFDGTHVSEKAFVRLFIDLFQREKKLAPYAAVPFLKKRLAEAKGNYLVFELDEF